MGIRSGTEDLSPLCFDLVAEVSNILTPQSTPVLQIWLEHDLNKTGIRSGTEDLSPLCFDLVSNILTPQSTAVLQIWPEHDLNKTGIRSKWNMHAFTAIDGHCLHTHSIAHRATEYHAV